MASIQITAGDDEMIAEIARAFPSMHVAILDPVRPDIADAGLSWLFVDWLLDDTSGLEVCRRLRALPCAPHCHITMILEADDADDRRMALKAGADDYMLGPVTAKRVIERLKALAVTGNGEVPARNRLTSNGLTIDFTAHQVRWQGRLITLRPREFRLLAIFMEHPDKLFSRSQLIALLGKDCEITDDRTVDVWVGHLRRKLESHGVPSVLRTVRSLGYVFDTPELMALA